MLLACRKIYLCQRTTWQFFESWAHYIYIQQHTKKLMSDRPGLVDFAVLLVDFILHLPERQVKVFGVFLFEEINLFIVLVRIISG